MSIFAWYGYEGSLYKRAKTLTDIGFSSLSLWWEREDGKSAEENLKILRDMGLNIDLVHLPYFPGGFWGKEKLPFEEAFLRALNELHSGEIARAVFHPTSIKELDLAIDQEGLELIYRLYQRAKILGVDLLVENLREDPHLFTLLENFDLGLCLDTGHLGISGNEKRLKKYFPRVRALHLHDNDGKSDLHLIPGDGILPLKTWLKDLPKGVEYHLEINRGLSEVYKDYNEVEYLTRAKKSLSLLE